MRMYGTNKILPVYGNYKPVERRRNNVKIAGWIPSTKQGESVSFANTYNDFAEVVIEGNTVQDGIPTPDAPIPIKSTVGNLLVNSNIVASIPELRNIGGVPDVYEPRVLVDGAWRSRRTQRIGVNVFDGTEFIGRNNNHNYYTAQIFTSSSYRVVCTHFKSTDTYIATGRDDRANTYVPDSRIYFQPALAYTTAAAFKAWLAAQYAAGTPVMVYYQLATPIITLGDPEPVPTYPRTTVIEQDGEVKGNIIATAKIVDNMEV